MSTYYDIERCLTCKFWGGRDEEIKKEAYKREVAYTDCKRYPEYATREKNDWCGEYKRK